MTTQKPKHYQLFRKNLENPIVAYELLQAHLPQEVLAIIDTSTLKLEKESFIEHNLTVSIADVLFSVKFNGNDGFIYLLLEHQSSPDHFMAFRLFKYMVNICDQYMTRHPKTKNLPLIYPLIIYNGTKSYNAPRNLWDLFNNEILAKKFWTEDHKIVNVHDIPDEEFKTRIWSGILEFFLKHIHERQLLKRWQQIADILPELSKVSIGYDYIEMILHYTLTSIDKNDKIELEKMLINTLNQEKGEDLMTSLAQAWKEEGIEIGILDGVKIGKQEGIKLGKAEGKAELIQMMLNTGNSVDDIAKVTGLSVDEIQKLI
jgi:predicted transposase/invertase (TIGR01784 family)